MACSVELQDQEGERPCGAPATWRVTFGLGGPIGGPQERCDEHVIDTVRFHMSIGSTKFVTVQRWPQ